MNYNSILTIFKPTQPLMLPPSSHVCRAKKKILNLTTKNLKLKNLIP